VKFKSDSSININKFFAEVFSNIADEEKMNVLHCLDTILNAFNKKA
jgi:hypothetical protein